MSEQLSFTKIENEIRPAYRNRLNTAESPEDIKKFFVYTAQEFLTRVLEDSVRVDYDDIQLTPESDPPYTLSERLAAQPEYIALTQRSDVHTILTRLAQSAARRYIHLEKHPDKSETKIRV